MFPKISRFLFLITSILMAFSSCKDSPYTELVKKEMGKGVVYDSLFLNHKLGQPKQAFFDICWELNKQKKVTHGPGNNYVQKVFTPKDSTQLNKRIQMLFYGIFNKDKIMTGMDMRFSFVSWAPWNRELQSDKIYPQIKDSLTKWFSGNDFVKIKTKTKKLEVLVKIDGNRRIMIEPIKDPQYVNVRIDDLRFFKK